MRIDARHDHDERCGATGEIAVLDVPVERLLLRDETEQWRESSHRRSADHRDDLHDAPPGYRREPVELADVAGAGLVVDDADHHEQCGLERSVGEDQNDAGLGDVIVADAEEQHHEPELADGAVREQQFQVVLAKRPKTADEHRGGPDDQHERPPAAGEGEHRCEARHEVDARLDHRGRVQVRTHRCRGDHGRRQPAAERCLRRLGERADQHQHQAGIDHRPRRWVDQQFGDPIGAAGLADDDQPGEHRQSTCARDEDRLQGGGTRSRIGVVVADEEVRRDRRELPEDEQRDELIRQDDAEHRPGEQREHAGEAGESGLVVAEVAERVHADQQADAGHERHHHEREGVEAEVDRDAELLDPGERLGHRFPVDDRARSGRSPDHRRQRRDRRDQERPPSQRAAGSDDADADDEVEGEEEEHLAGPTIRVASASSRTSRPCCASWSLCVVVALAWLPIGS